MVHAVEPVGSAVLVVTYRSIATVLATPYLNSFPRVSLRRRGGMHELLSPEGAHPFVIFEVLSWFSRTSDVFLTGHSW
jgi:hypothetical protein